MHTRVVEEQCNAVRRRFAFTFLLFAWLCANGAMWNVVQVVAWAKMFRDYSEVMPATQALRLTFDGSAPCDLCVVAQSAQDAAREQLPGSTVATGSAKLILAIAHAPALVLGAPLENWPGLVDEAGRTRSERVPSPPPRA